MEEFVYYNELYDLYGKLLTDKQKEYFENYYFNNLSLSEMADNYNVSRNAIHKQLKIAIEKLEDYEKKLGFNEKLKRLDLLIKNTANQSIREDVEKIFY